MQTRFTATATAGDGKEIILAFELLEEAFQVNLSMIPRGGLSAEQLEEWTGGATVEFPEGTTTINPNLNDDSILPVEIKTEEAGKIRIKQNEWAYRLLTNKLWESYLIELDKLKKRSEDLTTYDRSLFDDAKHFWERVLEHKKERDISQAKLDEIKEQVNKIFEKLKELRKNESSLFEENSSKHRAEALAHIEDFKTKLVEGANFKELFEELRQLQNGLKGKRFTKSDDALVRKAFDATFQQLNEARNSFASNKNASRIENLSKIVANMEKSLQRDKNDWDYYNKKVTSPRANALEVQLVKVKLNMLQEQITSKEAKIADIYQTLDKLKNPKRKKASVGGKPEPEATAESAVEEENLPESSEVLNNDSSAEPLENIEEQNT